MTPPVRTGAVQRTGSTSSDSDFLNVDSLLRDPAHADPGHFAVQWRDDQAFRLQHSTLYLALDALRAVFSGRQETVSAGQSATLRDFRTYAEAHPDGVEALALRNLRRALAGLHGDREVRARAVLEVVGQPPAEAPVSEPGASSSEAAATRPFAQFQAVTSSLHVADGAMRVLPSYYTLGALPPEGLGQTQNADAGVSLGGLFRIGDFNLFADGYFGANIVSDGSPDARYHRLSLRFGLYEPGGTFGARRGENGFYGSLLGRQRVGLGIGAAWCDRLQASDGSTASCNNSTFQIMAFNDRDLFSVGYGPFELGVRVLFNNGNFFLNTAPTGLSAANAVPLEFSLAWHLGPAPRVSAIAHPEATWPGVVFTGVNMLSNALAQNNRRMFESSYEGMRVTSLRGDLASRGIYSQTNLGTFFNGVLGGLGEAGIAGRLQAGLRYGDTAQRAVLGSMMGLELAALAIGAAAVPGETHNPETRATTINLQGQAFQLAWPTVLTRDALAVLGASGVFGDRESVIRLGLSSPGFVHYAIAHGVLAVGGLAMVFTSGDGSGNGFFNLSVLGNQFPNTPSTEVAGSPYDYPNQRSQYLRLEIGTMLLSYGLGNVLSDLLFGHYFQYLPERNRQLEEAERQRNPPAPAASRPSAHLGFNTDAQTRFMLTAEGTF